MLEYMTLSEVNDFAMATLEEFTEYPDVGVMWCSAVDRGECMAQYPQAGVWFVRAVDSLLEVRP